MLSIKLMVVMLLIIQLTVMAIMVILTCISMLQNICTVMIKLTVIL